MVQEGTAEVKHTPGPWSVHEVTEGRPLWHAEVRAPAGTAYRTVALCRSVQYQSADAALIAAAPDLLAACEAALTEFPEDDPKGVTMRLAAAIRKARGQADAAV